jgi:hypothetical protein
MSWTYTDISKEQSFTDGMRLFMHDFSMTKILFAVLDTVGPLVMLLCILAVFIMAGVVFFPLIKQLPMLPKLDKKKPGLPSDNVVGFSGTIDRYGSWQETRTHFQLKEYPERVFSVSMGCNGDHRDRGLHNSMLKEGDRVSFKVTAKELKKYQVPSVFDFENHSYKGPALQ